MISPFSPELLSVPTAGSPAKGEGARRAVPTPSPTRYTFERIKAEVARYYGIPAIDMVSARRDREAAWPRQVAMYLGRHLTPLSLPGIGRRLGNRDHTTIMHGIRAVEQRIASEDTLLLEIEIIKARLAR